MIAQHVAGKATRDALFLTTFDLARLPLAMLGAAGLSLVSALAVSRALARSTPARVVPILYATSAVAFVGEWLAYSRSPPLAAVLVFLHIAIFSGTTVSSFWTLVTERFDPRAAKRVVARVATGGALGGVLGGLVTMTLSRAMGVTWLFPLLATLNVASLWGASRLARGAKLAPAPGADQPTFRHFGAARYLRDLAALVCAAAVLQSVLDFLLSARAQAELPDRSALLAFFALFHTFVGFGTLLLQALFSRQALERLGLSGTVAVLPGATLLLGLTAVLAPSFPLTVALRGAEAALRGSLHRAGYELFYTPLPAAAKRGTKALIDVALDRAGTALGSGAVLAGLAVASASVERIGLGLAVGLCALSLWLCVRLYGGYRRALAESLLAGTIEIDDSGALDATTRRTLAETTAAIDRRDLLAKIDAFNRTREATPTPSPAAEHAATPTDPVLAAIADLRSPLPPRVRAALGAPLDPAAAPHVVALLANDALARDALRALRVAAPRITGLLVDALLDRDRHEAVRRRVPRALREAHNQRALDGLVEGLGDPSLVVRRQCARALADMRAWAHRHEDAGLSFPSDRFLEQVTRELSRVTPGHSHEALRPTLTHVFELLALVYDAEPLRAAALALDGTDPALRGTALEYLEVTLPAAVRDPLWPFLEEGPLPRRSDRATAEIAEELLRSATALPRWTQPETHDGDD